MMEEKLTETEKRSLFYPHNAGDAVCLGALARRLLREIDNVKRSCTSELAEIPQLLCRLRERSGVGYHVRLHDDGDGTVWRSDGDVWTLVGNGRSPQETLAVLRDLVGPPPPTKEEALEILENWQEASRAKEGWSMIEARKEIRRLRCYVEAQGEPK